MAETAAVDISRVVVPVGAEVCVTQAEVTFLTGEVWTTNDLHELARRLRDAVEHPAGREPLLNLDFRRSGYHRIRYALRVPGDDLKHWLEVTWPESRKWGALCDFDLSGEPECFYGREYLADALWADLTVDGQKLADFFSRLGSGMVGKGYIKRYSAPVGLHAYDDLVGLTFAPAHGIMGQGPIRLIRDRSYGDLYRRLAVADGGIGGRDDQVGNHERYSRSNGP
ncbi:hypothetical protein A2215_03740 [Candidatus Berkelbacteria bacterium RIFOXYA2_FULL_43_10]|uniref:Uncharacterized protein n=1 Tax=Candidatus Berkelbacteria bacterium RIFOXYA2_FULL_43_10 TaxID=1797472 RepID=A0A1F5E4I6_9BACT|nr:MAG: hypothetical protein A2215_03740 [Candidatus Berkelbacteria bacterium RIFOXYA2_FULL_43_10]